MINVKINKQTFRFILFQKNLIAKVLDQVLDPFRPFLYVRLYDS